MLFNSVAFLLFFPLVVLGDQLLQRRERGRKTWLLGASLFFYGCWDWRFLSLILLSIVVDWFVGNALHASEDPRRRKKLVTLSLCVNLGLLGVFKYLGFFVDSALAGLHALGFAAGERTLEIVLPVGISFYTFQTLSYTLDIYRRQLRPADTFLDFALFVSFFPQLVAGPIVRAATFLPQLSQNPRATRVGLSMGLYNLLSGLIKKVVLADYLGVKLVDPLHADPSAFGTLGALAGIYGYAFQIYGDFAGYSQMAIGGAQILGFRLPVNFRSPYLARTMSEFWTRWHISLSSWLRDYLYIPLGGSRGTKAFTRRNLMITMLLGGLWHGAGWNFLLWGAIHGSALLVSHALREKRELAGRELASGFLAIAAQRLTVFHVWALSMVFFRSRTFEDALDVFRAAFSGGGGNPAAAGLLMLAIAAALHWAGETWNPKVRRTFVRMAPELQGATLVVVLALASMFTGAARPFIYFQF